MTAPRIEIDLNKIRENTRYLVRRLGARGLSVTEVTKAVCGHPGVARAMLEGGVTDLADTRLSNVHRMRAAGISGPISMLRAPMRRQANDILRTCDTSYATELSTIQTLGTAARHQGIPHTIVLMVEMGDQREGIPPRDLGDFAAQVMATPGVTLLGIAANFACLSNAAPTPRDMAALSHLAAQVERKCGTRMALVSGGGSANLAWALGDGATGRVNNLRLGEAILLGIDPVTGRPIPGLHTDAFALFAEVIEARPKPGPKGSLRNRAILALGLQDTDANGLDLPAGFGIIGATSDHTVVDTAHTPLPVGSEMKMGLTYSALMRAMNAPDVTKNALGKRSAPGTAPERATRPALGLV